MTEAHHPFTAIIGDVVRSRRYRGIERANLQRQIENVLEDFNLNYRGSIRSEFVLTEGDSFQALLDTAHEFPDMIWEMEMKLKSIEIRLGVGYGTIDTELRQKAVGMDGSAFHTAREALKLAEKKRLLGGVFKGFGEFEDRVLNAFARVLRHMRANLTDQQRTVAHLLREDPTRTQTSVAQSIGITRQAVSDHVRSMGWDALTTGEDGWRATLRKFTDKRYVSGNSHL